MVEICEGFVEKGNYEIREKIKRFGTLLEPGTLIVPQQGISSKIFSFKNPKSLRG